MNSLAMPAHAYMGNKSEPYPVIRWLAYGLLLATPWGLIWSRAFCEVTFGMISLLFIARSIYMHDWEWTKSPTIRFGFALWLWMIFVVTPFAEVSAQKSFYVSVPWIRYLLFYAAARYWLLVDKKPQELLAWMLLPFFAFIAVDTLVQYWAGVSLTGNIIQTTNRLSGPMDNVKVGIFLSKLLLPWIGMALLCSPARYPRLYYASVMAVFFFGWIIILLSGERTMFLISTFSIVCGLLFLTMAGKKIRFIALGFITLLLISLIAAYTTQEWVQFRAMELQEQLGTFPQSSYGQLIQGSYVIGKEHWLTGTGFKGFRELCLGLFEQQRISYCDLHPHNPYMEFFSEAGIVGLLLFAGLSFSLLREVIQKMHGVLGMQSILVASAFATWMIHFFPFMLTQSVNSNWPAMVLWLSVAIGFSALNVLPRASGEAAQPAAR